MSFYCEQSCGQYQNTHFLSSYKISKEKQQHFHHFQKETKTLNRTLKQLCVENRIYRYLFSLSFGRQNVLFLLRNTENQSKFVKHIGVKIEYTGNILWLEKWSPNFCKRVSLYLFHCKLSDFLEKNKKQKPSKHTHTQTTVGKAKKRPIENCVFV